MLPINTVDKNVGNRLKARRTAIGMSSETLAAELGVMNGQIETWEAGHTRIPPSLLLDMSKILGTNASYFFRPSHSIDGSDEIEDNGNGSAKPNAAQTPTSKDRSLVKAFRKITDPKKQDAILKFAQRLADRDTGAEP